MTCSRLSRPETSKRRPEHFMPGEDRLERLVQRREVERAARSTAAGTL